MESSVGWIHIHISQDRYISNKVDPNLGEEILG